MKKVEANDRTQLTTYRTLWMKSELQKKLKVLKPNNLLVSNDVNDTYDLMMETRHKYLQPGEGESQGEWNVLYS